MNNTNTCIIISGLPGVFLQSIGLDDRTQPVIQIPNYVKERDDDKDKKLYQIYVPAIDTKAMLLLKMKPSKEDGEGYYIELNGLYTQQVGERITEALTRLTTLHYKLMLHITYKTNKIKRTNASRIQKLRNARDEILKYASIRTKLIATEEKRHLGRFLKQNKSGFQYLFTELLSLLMKQFNNNVRYLGDEDDYRSNTDPDSWTDSRPTSPVKEDVEIHELLESIRRGPPDDTVSLSSLDWTKTDEHENNACMEATTNNNKND